MSLVRIDRNPTRTQLAIFGAAWLLFFGALGGGVLRRGGPAGVVAALWLTAIIVPGIGWRAPRFMRLVYIGMSLLAFPATLVVSYAALAVVYYLVLTPIGLLMRLFGYDPMKRRFGSAAKSYWVALHPPADLRSYFRQF